MQNLQNEELVDVNDWSTLLRSERRESTARSYEQRKDTGRSIPMLTSRVRGQRSERADLLGTVEQQREPK